METRIARWGNSHGIRLPREALREAGLEVGDTVRVEVEDNHIVIEKARRVRGRYRLEELVARVPRGHRPQEEDWGQQVGAEEW